jgi:alpha-N-arabinofuranosidase
VTASASIKDGVVTLTAANLHADQAEKVLLEIAGCDVKNVTARILTGEMHAKNTFEDQHAVEIADFTGFTVTEEGIELDLPGCSVVEVTIRG